MSAPLEPGTTLGGRFAIIGVLGRGGTATVYLAVDQLRGEKVALKVVHDHLAADAKVRRRIQREVRASTLLRHDAALVPWDLHDLDGVLALSMPYHPGRTLREQVSAQGPLAIQQVRTLGQRVASALAEAHRSGLLHLDVTPNNVLVEGGQAPVLTDFGLSRAQTDATRSTGVMGTAGFMAPERLSEARPLPSADLYGLGCVLYFAVTGQAPFPTDNPMATLQAQLSESAVPVQQLRTDCPTDIAETIHALLAKDPNARPASAAAVADALQHQVGARIAVLPTSTRRAHLEPGAFAVVVEEREPDRARRNHLRIDHKKAPNTLDATVSKRARELMQGVLTFVGITQDADASPEQLLVQAIADEANVPASALSQPVVLVQKKFVLVEHVARSAANHIATDARTAGFNAHVVEHHDAEAFDFGPWLKIATTLGWVGLGLSWMTPYHVFAFYFLFAMIAFTMIANNLRKRTSKTELEGLPVAYGNRLTRWLGSEHPGRYALDGGEPTQVQPEPQQQSRGAQMLNRASGEIDGLLRTVEALELNTIAQSDLRTTAKALRERASQLAEQVDRLETELANTPEDTSWMEPRLHRLRTKRRAGEPVDSAEITTLEASLEAAQRAELHRDALESRHLAAIAGLLEIGSTATSVRRNLLADPEPETANQAVRDLRREAEAADRARREV